MADAIPAANAGILAAQAQSGMDGVKAYQQAQETLKAQQQAAVQTAMQEAALRGAPAGAAQSQAGIINAPYDMRQASLAQNQASFQADMAARDQRYGAYQGAVNEARTLIPGEVEKIVAPIRARGEAEIRNTTRQGEMTVAQINAQNELALTRMRAAQQAAEIAAAKAGGGGGGSKAGSKGKMTDTELAAALSKGALGKMQQSMGSGYKLMAENETKQANAKQGFETARGAQITQGKRDRMQNENEGYNGVISQRVMNMKTTNTPQAGTGVPAGGAQKAPVSQLPKPVPPTRKAGQIPEAYQAQLDAYYQQLAQWTALNQVALQPNGGLPMNVRPTAPVVRPATGPHPMGPYSAEQNAGMNRPTDAMGRLNEGYNGVISPQVAGMQSTTTPQYAPPMKPRTVEDIQGTANASRAQALALAKQQQAARMAPLLAQQAEAGKLNDPSLYSSDWGSITEDQMKWIQGTDPLLAASIGGAGTPITTQNISSYLAGDPDLQGAVNPYSLDVAQAARELAWKDLVEQGYDISQADFDNATQDDWKPGETWQQYNQRHTGELSAQDTAKLVAEQQDEQRRADAAARENTRFQVWWEDYQRENTPIDGVGMSLNDIDAATRVAAYQKFLASTDPETGRPFEDQYGQSMSDDTASRQAGATKIEDQDAATKLLGFLPSLPPQAKFGTPMQIAAAVDPEGGMKGTDQDGKEVPVWLALYDFMSQATSDVTGMSAAEFNQKINSSTGVKDYWKNLTPLGQELMKYYFYDSTKKDD